MSLYSPVPEATMKMASWSMQNKLAEAQMFYRGLMTLLSSMRLPKNVASNAPTRLLPRNKKLEESWVFSVP
jgi:hypothetical protein